MLAEYVEQDQLSSFFGRGELGQRHEVDHFTETVDDGQDDSIAVRRGKACNKVHGDMGPQAVGNRKRLQKSWWEVLCRLQTGQALTNSCESSFKVGHQKHWRRACCVR